MGKFGGGGRFFFFFYDITKIRSFNYINVYLKQLKNYLFICDKEEKIPNFCIIGNKYDLENEININNENKEDNGNNNYIINGKKYITYSEKKKENEEQMKKISTKTEFKRRK